MLVAVQKSNNLVALSRMAALNLLTLCTRLLGLGLQVEISIGRKFAEMDHGID